MNIKVEIKEETCLMDFYSQNEGEHFATDPLKKVKNETDISGSSCDVDTMTEIEQNAMASNLCSQKQIMMFSENHVMRYNKSNKDSEVETKVEINEQWWLDKASTETPHIYKDVKNLCSSCNVRVERSISCLKRIKMTFRNITSQWLSFLANFSILRDLLYELQDDSIERFAALKDRESTWSTKNKDGTNKDFCLITSPSLYKEDITSSASNLLSNEDGHCISLSIKNYELGCESTRNLQSQESDAIDVPSIQASTCTEKSDSGKTVSMDSCLKQNNLLLQSISNKLDISKENWKLFLSHKYREALKCDICEKSFKYLCRLKMHRLVHESKKAIKSDVCETDFNNLSLLKKHKIIHQDKKAHRCNICNKAFIHLSKLKRHIWIHEGIKPHKCDICNKDFTQIHHLKRHTLSHEGIKSYNCSICYKAFANLQYLKRHKLSHEGVMPYKCNICNKVFAHLQHLKIHKSMHKGIKEHKCNICNKDFVTLRYLETHRLIHEGTKPNQCDICKRTFTHLSSFKRHKLIHEGIKPNQCDICSKAFTHMSALKRHKLIHKR